MSYISETVGHDVLTTGRKYDKVTNRINGRGSHSAVAFIDRATGTWYWAAGWSKPAKTTIGPEDRATLTALIERTRIADEIRDARTENCDRQICIADVTVRALPTGFVDDVTGIEPTLLCDAHFAEIAERGWTAA